RPEAPVPDLVVPLPEVRRERHATLEIQVAERGARRELVHVVVPSPLLVVEHLDRRVEPRDLREPADRQAHAAEREQAADGGEQPAALARLVRERHGEAEPRERVRRGQARGEDQAHGGASVTLAVLFWSTSKTTRNSSGIAGATPIWA